jgi:hypothetical protein
MGNNIELSPRANSPSRTGKKDHFKHGNSCACFFFTLKDKQLARFHDMGGLE